MPDTRWHAGPTATVEPRLPLRNISHLRRYSVTAARTRKTVVASRARPRFARPALTHCLSLPRPCLLLKRQYHEVSTQSLSLFLSRGRGRGRRGGLPLLGFSGDAAAAEATAGERWRRKLVRTIVSQDVRAL